MAHHPIHKIGARWAVPALLLVLGALLEVGCDKDSPEVTTSESSLTPLWEGESKDLEEWQLLKSPSHIIMGPPGELFISTERQGTVVRCSTEGHLVEVIGGKGEGPGEFQSTGDMVFDGQSSILWVSDAASRNRIISRFKIKRRSISVASIVEWFQRVYQRLLWPTHTAFGVRILVLSIQLTVSQFALANPVLLWKH
jgi:hypothetical protein